ncbi:GntR family transcriptional regulator [Streptomyces cocklensis]|nr:GntR family transcriptional regulator [Actinacidiphila cocklensis]WSX76168.1 GntR family transcriptional regulator [Streptomyces sp. NBC_00899]
MTAWPVSGSDRGERGWRPMESVAPAQAGRAPLPAPRRMPERHSVRDQVLAELRDALLAGELPPGSVHSGPALAARYGVSATPVREAMQLLAKEGAVEVLPNRGFRVVCYGERELAQIAEVRMLVEVPVVIGLARSLPTSRWEELRPAAEAGVAAAAAGSRAGYAEADRAFHRALLGLGGNPHVVAVADDLHRRAQWPTAGPVQAPRPSLSAHAAHHAVLLAALGGGGGAEPLLRAHLASCP